MPLQGKQKVRQAPTLSTANGARQNAWKQCNLKHNVPFASSASSFERPADSSSTSPRSPTPAAAAAARSASSASLLPASGAGAAAAADGPASVAPPPARLLPLLVPAPRRGGGREARGLKARPLLPAAPGRGGTAGAAGPAATSGSGTVGRLASVRSAVLAGSLQAGRRGGSLETAGGCSEHPSCCKEAGGPYCWAGCLELRLRA